MDAFFQEYDHESIIPIQNSNFLPVEEFDGNEPLIKENETILIKRRPAKTKQKKTENVIMVDHEVTIVKPDEHVPPCTELSGRVYGVVEDKHLIMYTMNSFDLIDLTKSDKTEKL